jgi:hypothetical protein
VSEGLGNPNDQTPKAQENSNSLIEKKSGATALAVYGGLGHGFDEFGDHSVGDEISLYI